MITFPPAAGTYRTIYADPPWHEQGGGRIKRGADRHYPLMKTQEICRLPVDKWAAPNAHLYLWVTNNYVPDGLEVMRAWGFRYVTKIDWYKGYFDDYGCDVIGCLQDHLSERLGEVIDEDLIEVWAPKVVHDMSAVTSNESLDGELQVGLGQYFRGVSESCLFGVRGSLPYKTIEGKRAQGRSGFHAPRGEHSAKPEKMRQMIERVSHGPYLEMFARRPVDGWDLWGNEAPLFSEASA